MSFPPAGGGYSKCGSFDVRHGIRRIVHFKKTKMHRLISTPKRSIVRTSSRNAWARPREGVRLIGDPTFLGMIPRTDGPAIRRKKLKIVVLSDFFRNVELSELIGQNLRHHLMVAAKQYGNRYSLQSGFIVFADAIHVGILPYLVIGDGRDLSLNLEPRHPIHLSRYGRGHVTLKSRPTQQLGKFWGLAPRQPRTLRLFKGRCWSFPSDHFHSRGFATPYAINGDGAAKKDAGG